MNESFDFIPEIINDYFDDESDLEEKVHLLGKLAKKLEVFLLESPKFVVKKYVNTLSGDNDNISDGFTDYSQIKDDSVKILDDSVRIGLIGENGRLQKLERLFKSLKKIGTSFHNEMLESEITVAEDHLEFINIAIRENKKEHPFHKDKDEFDEIIKEIYVNVKKRLRPFDNIYQEHDYADYESESDTISNSTLI
ncbi:MAG: hypothetical protein MHPSP_003810 [Paramarteilia canceri]